jgi:hypothetical protein
MLAHRLGSICCALLPFFRRVASLGFCSSQDYLSKVRTQTLSDSVPDGGAANSLGTPAGKILIGLRTVLKC